MLTTDFVFVGHTVVIAESELARADDEHDTPPAAGDGREAVAKIDGRRWPGGRASSLYTRLRGAALDARFLPQEKEAG
jgi:hypothetical protein